ncbi:tetratricopeptide repeat-containing glycosyltransferase family 2 protein [Paenibacillus planticolens]|uniref:Glycosyltransferase n=1 Tax=Paenibacillus planticolens TaxID=2654976 RepID=A0ABX1ZFR7_9BACL|nr:glycosyltransferase family 2 protein [Paenibacillus planticolens]NOU98944.1 glycosyltransferase [Paenibacillus planticolens]
MITISLCMIVKNEELSLHRCLQSVRDIADEIIIVDTGSTDRTKEIASSFTELIYDMPWKDHFAEARNFAFSKATMDYILWLDADDELEEEDRRKFAALKSSIDPSVDSVMMPYHLAFDADNKVITSLKRNRLVRRACGFRWEGPVHEVLIVSGHVMQSDIAITHKKDKQYTDRNLRIYQQRESEDEIFSPRDLYYYANELKDHGLDDKAVMYYERFLATKQGWREDCFAACLKMGDCYGKLANRQMQLKAWFRTLLYGKPRAEMCCRVGSYFMEDNRLELAIYWFQKATTLGEPADYAGMVDHAAWTWLPHLQLCLCYDRTGQKQKAELHNEIAFVYNPAHPGILHNKAYFANLRREEKTP